MSVTTEATGLTQVLTHARAADQKTRQNAEKQLAQAENENFIPYCRALCTELANETKPDDIRQFAGIMFKNAISGKDPRIDFKRRERWIGMDEAVKVEFRTVLLKVLESDCLLASSAACQCISKIARLDIPQGLWLEFFITIERNVTQEANTALRLSSYQVLGYICEDIKCLCDEINQVLLNDEIKGRILVLLSRGLMDLNVDVRLSALKAFYHGVLFAERFMQSNADRQKLFQLIGECLACANEPVELAAWEVIFQITNKFYPLLAEYMTDLKVLSVAKIREGETRIALSAIEFWCTLCDEEIMIIQGESSQPSCAFVSAHKDSVLPALFDAITREVEDTDMEEWTVSMAAGTAVNLFAQVLKDGILDLALRFMQANFGGATWQQRNAAILVYGSILEGPQTSACDPIIRQSFPSLCIGLNDASAVVRDTTAWTVGRVAEFHMGTIVGYLTSTVEGQGLIEKLITLLNDEPRVAANVCYALYEICAEWPHVSKSTTHLNKFFPVLAEALVAVAKRPDADERQLRQAACHALYILIENASGVEQRDALKILLEQIMEWMEGTFATQSTNPDIPLIQGPMCGCLNALITQLDQESLPYMEKLFTIFHHTLDNKAANSCWNEAAEEVFMAIGSLLNAAKERFLPFVPILTVLLKNALRSHDDTQVCSIAIDLSGSLASSGDSASSDAVIEELFIILKDVKAPMFLKPKAITALSDFALITPHVFVKHLKSLFEFLKQATSARISEGPNDCDDWVEYITGLRDATLTAYLSAVCCVRDTMYTGESGQQIASQAYKLLENEIGTIVDFLRVVVEDNASTESNIASAIVLMGDLVPVFKEPFVKHITVYPFYTLVKEKAALNSVTKTASERLESLIRRFAPL